MAMSRWTVLLLATLGASGLAAVAFGAGAGLWTAALLGGLGTGMLARRRQAFPLETLRALHQVAGQAGLVQDDFQGAGLVFRGIRAECRLAFIPHRAEAGTRVRLELAPKHPIPGHMVSDVQVAHEGFDPGGQPLGAALVSGRLRALCRVGDHLQLARGQLAFETGFDPADPPDLGALADALAEGLNALSHGERSVPARLHALVAEDPDPGVRGLALEALASEPALGPEAEQAMGCALADEDPALRLRAAQLLGGAAQDVLQALISDEAVDAETRAGALTALSRGVAVGTLADVARRCLDDPHPSLRTAAADVLGRAQHPGAPEALRARLAGAESRELCAVAQALARVGGPEVSVDLARALARARTTEAPTLLAALAVLGDGRSTGAIRAFARRPGLPQELSFAAQGALRAIQARGSVEEAGSLSLSEASDAGALSEAPLAPGDLSVAGPRDG
jgi:hypothetical protein